MPFPAPTHQVLNQPEALRNYNPYSRHPALREALRREGGQAFEPQVHDFAETAAAKIGPLGFEANEFAPRLRTHDRFRSEERRVGKEGRSWGTTDHLRNKMMWKAHDSSDTAKSHAAERAWRTLRRN